MAGKSKEQQLPQPLESNYNYFAGAYLRLSVEKRYGEKSESIENQQKYICDYVSMQADIKIVKSYIDDEVTGTNYERAGFKEMMQDIKNGKINCIITKDYSRLGRNAEKTDEYITTIFPFMNIRYIAINENYDSLYVQNKDFSLELSIKNLFNEQYAVKASQNISITLDRLRREGKYIGPRPPYGYLIDTKDHHHLMIEKETYKTVERIFQMIANGHSYYEIVKWLQENKISPPFKHCYELGLFYKDKYKNANQWYCSTIKAIASNPVYYGALVVSKHKRALWRGIPNHKIPKDKWEIVENTHEAIIDKALYFIVQDEMEHRRLAAKEKEKKSVKRKVENIFSQKIFCGCCKKRMIRTFYCVKGGTRKYYFRCSEYIYKYGKCKKSYIPELVLKDVIMKLLKQHRKLMELYNQQNKEKKQNKEKLIQLRKKEMNENRNLQNKLYADFKKGMINEEKYLFLKDKYKADNCEILKQLKISNECNQREDEMKLPKRLQLNREIIDSFIEYIEVYSSDNIHVKFKFNHDFLISGGENK